MPHLQYVLDREASFPCFSWSSGELVARMPRTLGEGSLVVAASHRGTTAETVEAARLAREAGATVVGLVRDPGTPLGDNADHVLTYGRDEIVTDAKVANLAMLGARLLERTGDWPPDPERDAAFRALPNAVVTAMEEQDTELAALAERLADEQIIYLVGTGPTYGTAYSFAMCTLQEAQWIHASAVNATEFFHGMFEVVEPGVPVIVLLDESPSRHLAERVLAFARRYTDKAIAVDSRDFALPGIPASQRPFLAPIALGSVLYRLTKQFEGARGRSLDDRRYMFVVEY